MCDTCGGHAAEEGHVHPHTHEHAGTGSHTHATRVTVSPATASVLGDNSRLAKGIRAELTSAASSCST